MVLLLALQGFAQEVKQLMYVVHAGVAAQTVAVAGAHVFAFWMHVAHAALAGFPAQKLVLHSVAHSPGSRHAHCAMAAVIAAAICG